MNKNTVEFLKNYQGEKLIKLKENFNLINITLESVVEDLINESSNLQRNKKYNEALQLVEIQKDVNQTISNHVELMESLNNETNNMKTQSTNKTIINKEKNTNKERNLSYYDNYEVNNSEPHAITEDLRFKRPFAFEVNGYYEETQTWKEMLVETCKYLYKQDPGKFKSFANDESMQWGETHNFSTNKDLIREPHLIGDSGVYIEIAKSALGVRQMIIKLLNKYEISIESYKVYLRADYSIKRELDETYRRRPIVNSRKKSGKKKKKSTNNSQKK